MVLKTPSLTLGQILVLGALIALAVYQHLQVRSLEGHISRSQDDLRGQMQSFNRDLGRAQTSFTSSHEVLSSLLKAVPVAIRQDLARMNAEIASFSEFKVTSKSRGKGRVRPDPPALAVLPSSEPASCDWSFSDWRMEGRYTGGCGGGDFTYALNQTFEGVLLRAEAPGASAHYVKVWELDGKGSRIEPPLALNDFVTIERPEVGEGWQIPAVHLDLGLGADLSPSGQLLLSPHLGVSFLGYGKTKDDLNWRFLKATASPLEDAVGVGACPFSYNVGKNLPLLSNVWLSPCYVYRGGHSASLQLSGVL